MGTSKTDADRVNDFLITSEVAPLFKVCERTVRYWADEGRIPCVRDSKNRRKYHKQKILKLAAKGVAP